MHPHIQAPEYQTRNHSEGAVSVGRDVRSPGRQLTAEDPRSQSAPCTRGKGCLTLGIWDKSTKYKSREDRMCASVGGAGCAQPTTDPREHRRDFVEQCSSPVSHDTRHYGLKLSTIKGKRSTRKPITRQAADDHPWLW
ncbi:hypothetical protein EVAR_88744_1 [Eumeta japonica]|uniref:Uncharacterized protein n=1 Tax=Eumeta variegata TaxID=151549 RepID=A0A4C1XTG0_EUMVA|nr:hypothetical protein EVAR_88744_1 [Eumeta japonica]